MHRKPRHVLSTLLIALMGLLMGVQVQWPDAMISALSWSPDGEWIATGRYDGSLIIQNMYSKEVVELSTGFWDPIAEIAWRNNTQFLAIELAGTGQLWDVTNQTQIQSFPFTYGMLSALWEEDKAHFISGNSHGFVHERWHVDTAKVVISTEQGNTVSDLAWSPDKSHFISSSSSGNFSVLDSQTLKAIHKIEIDKKPLAILVTAAWQPTGQFIAVGDVYGVVRVYAADTLEPVAEFSVSDQPQIDVRQGWFSKSLITLSFIADGASLLTVTADGTVQTWRVPDFTRVSNETLGVFVADAAWSPYQGQLAYALRPQVISEGVNVRTVDSGNLSEIQIFVPAPTIDRLNAIAELCVRDATTQSRAVTGLASQRVTSLNALPDFVAQVESLPEGAIPAACRADLLTVADALR